MIERNIIHCRFCGSQQIVENIEVVGRSMSEITFDPQVETSSISGIPAKFSAIKYGKKKSKGYHYNDSYCKTCKNINVINSDLPKVMTLNKDNAVFIIPAILNQQLEINNYDDDKIKKMISSMTKKLEKIYKKWSKDKGCNPCKGNRVGHGIKIRLCSKLNIMCHVIIELICKKIVLGCVMEEAR